MILLLTFYLYFSVLFFFFFFSSRRRHTRCHGDWSSDVCSSDLTLRLCAQRSPIESAAMRICRFDDDRLGLVDGETIHDVSAALERLPQVRYPFPRHDALIAH